MEENQWNDNGMHCFGMLMDGRAPETGIRQKGSQATLLLVLNAHHDSVAFQLPVCPGGHRWSRLVDTNIPIDEPGAFYAGASYTVTARSLLLFALETPQNTAG